MEQDVNHLVVFAVTVVIMDKLQETVHLLFRNCFSCHSIIHHHSYVAVEGYAKLSDQRNDFDFQGPYRLYQKAGFIEIAREKEQVVMRKVL